MTPTIQVSEAATEFVFPIAESFLSVQGEGAHAGTVMHFVRFAGCTVGKPYGKEERIMLGLKVYQERCTSWDGKSFPCDTQYSMSKKMSISNILTEVGDTQRVCLTGGEPLMHKLEPVIVALLKAGKKVHIETSGTIDTSNLLSAAVPYGVWKLWICVSPKANYLRSVLDSASEIKILVGEGFNKEDFLARFSGYMSIPDKVFIQPINDEWEYNKDNMARCVALQLEHPSLRLSLQLHKLLHIR